MPGRSSGVRASGTVGFDSFPYYRITPYGKAILSRSEIDPIDKTGFLKDARARLGSADERIYTYLSEANDGFKRANYLSAAVMLGVSCELLMKWLIDRFIEHAPERERLQKLRGDLWMRTNKLFSAFVREFQKHYDEFPRDVGYQADANLDFMQTLIRINRDDVGHGRPDRIDRHMVHGYLISYLTLLKVAHELAEAFTITCTMQQTTI